MAQGAKQTGHPMVSGYRHPWTSTPQGTQVLLQEPGAGD